MLSTRLIPTLHLVRQHRRIVADLCTDDRDLSSVNLRSKVSISESQLSASPTLELHHGFIVVVEESHKHTKHSMKPLICYVLLCFVCYVHSFASRLLGLTWSRRQSGWIIVSLMVLFIIQCLCWFCSRLFLLHFFFCFVFVCLILWLLN